MPPDTVQIGSMVISNSLLNIIFPLASGWIGVLIGGLITYLTTMAVENRRWQREKKDKLQQERRDAFACAREWMVPTSNAVISAHSLVSAYSRNDINEGQFLSDFPDLLWSLPTDPPAHLEVFLGDSYRQLMEITRGLRDLKVMALRTHGTSLEAIQQCSQLLDDLQAKSDNLKRYLGEEHLKTFA